MREVQLADGRSAFFAITEESEVIYCIQTPSGETNWMPLGGVSGFTQLCPVASTDGRLVCLAVGNGVVWMNQLFSNNYWCGWEPLPSLSGISRVQASIHGDSLEIEATAFAPFMLYDRGDAAVSFYLWNTTGYSFPFKQTINLAADFSITSVGPRMAASDVDGDGTTENVIMCQSDTGLARLLVFDNLPTNVAPKTWWQSQKFDLRRASGKLVAGDFNGDGRGDVLLLSSESNGVRGCIHRFLSTGHSFEEDVAMLPPDYDLAKTGENVASADVNGDGKTDLVLACQTASEVAKLHVFLNGVSFTGSEGWFQLESFDLNAVGGRMAGGDFNGDGKDDVIMFRAETSGMTSHRFLSDGTAFHHDTFNIPSGYTLGNIRNNMIAGDVDGDGLADVIVAYQYPDNTMRLHVFPHGNSYAGPAGWFQSGAFNLNHIGGRMTMMRTVKRARVFLSREDKKTPSVADKKNIPTANIPSPKLPDTDYSAPLSSYHSRLFTPSEDISRNVVQSIVQTPDGFLWIGTQNGLARFDGERFEFLAFNHNRPDSQRVNALDVDSSGDLWAGTAEGLFELKEQHWLQHPMLIQNSENILDLHCHEDGSVLIGTVSGLACFNSGQMRLLIGDAGQKRSVNSDIVRSMSPSPDNNLWVGTGNRLSQLNHGCLVRRETFSDFKQDFIRAVCHRRNGTVWVGSNSGIIEVQHATRLDSAGDRPVYTHFTKADGLPDNTVSAIYEDRHGVLWIGTYGGLCRLVDGKFITETTSEGEPYPQVFCFYEDREDNLWMGSKEGLHQLIPQRFATYTTRNGLAHNNVISVYEDAETNLWVGTWGGGLHRFHKNQWTTHVMGNTPALRNDLLLALAGSNDGSIWFSEDYDGGLYQWKNGEISRHQSGGNAIRCLMEDNEGRLWMGRATAYLSVWQNGKITAYGKQSGLPANAIRCLLQTADQRIWVGTEAGLCYWTNNSFTTPGADFRDTTIFSLHEDKTRNLWIGTAQGLRRMRSPNPAALSNSLHLDRFHFCNDAILEILEDDFGNLWLATRRGVLRVAKSELEKSADNPSRQPNFTRFGKADGMASPVCVGVAKPSAFKSKDGRLWFATTKGLAVTDPRLRMAKNEKPPPLAIREVVAGKQRVNLSTAGDSPAEKSFLSLPPGPEELEFHFAALSFTDPGKNKFKYRLDGLDTDWIDGGTHHEAFYNHVPPGQYAFRVIACNSDGVWNTAGATLAIVLQPHFWQTWWFKICAALACLSFVAGSARYATKKRLQFKLQRLEQQQAIERERARIAQDMHDDLGARLTQILMLNDFALKAKNGEAEVKQQVAKAAQVTQDLVRNLDGIVWAVNPQNDSLDSLATYLAEYFEMFFAAGSIRYRLDVPAALPSWTISSATRHNIFLVVKEALNNVVKHAQASEVWLRLSLDCSALSIEIEDNGRGISCENQSVFSSGLLNMQKRAESMGGHFELKSQVGKGTRIRLKIPLPGF